MNLWLLSAGIGALLLNLVHIFLGGREIHRPMVAAHWPEPAKAIWSVVWHAVTAVIAFGGLALVAAAFLPDLALALSVLPVALFGSSAGLFIFYGLKRLGSLRILPQWVAFAAISALAVIGLVTWPPDARMSQWQAFWACSLHCTWAIIWLGFGVRIHMAQCRTLSGRFTATLSSSLY